MVASESTLSSIADRTNRIREMREYTEIWAHHMSRAGQAGQSQTITRGVFEDVLNHILSPLKVVNPLPRHIHDFIACHLTTGVPLKELSAFLG